LLRTSNPASQDKRRILSSSTIIDECLQGHDKTLRPQTSRYAAESEAGRKSGNRNTEGDLTTTVVIADSVPLATQQSTSLPLPKRDLTTG
jgi:hypothetical protein